jgi:hypothetical protein
MMAEFESRYGLYDVVFYKQPGELAQQYVVAAVTFDESVTNYHCRRSDGVVVGFHEDDLVSAQIMNSIRQGRLDKAEEEGKGIGFDDD